MEAVAVAVAVTAAAAAVAVAAAAAVAAGAEALALAPALRLGPAGLCLWVRARRRGAVGTAVTAERTTRASTRQRR